MVSGFEIGDSDTVHIDVAIAADYTNYEIGDDSAIAVQVKDNDDPSTTNPRLSIAAVATEPVRLSPSVTSVGFTITASDDPSDNDLSVNVVVSETQNFIASTFDKTTSINFEDAGTTTLFNVDVVDPTNQNDTDSDITVTLVDGSGYTIADAPGNAATASVNDNPVPQLTLIPTNSDPSIDESGTAVAHFTVVSNNAVPANFKVNYQITQVGDFLATTPAVPAVSQLSNNLRFSGSGGRFTADLNTSGFAIRQDDIPEATGSVTVTLLAQDQNSGEYTLGDPVSATITVYDDDAPELEIADGSTVTEGSGNKAIFTVTSRFDITGELRVRYQPDDGIGNFLAINLVENGQAKMLDFKGGKTATIELDIIDDEVAEETGSVQVELLADDSDTLTYTVAGAPDNIGTVVVSDDDTLATKPNVSIASEYLPTGATEATYYIVADSAPTSDMEVVLEYNYEIDDPNNSANKIDQLPESIRAVVTISAGETFTDFTADTHNTVNSVTGTLKVSLVDGTNYDLGTPNSSGIPANVATAAEPLVSITREGDLDRFESDGLKFVARASPYPTNDIPVTVHVTQTGSFIDATIETISGEGVVVKRLTIPSTGTFTGEVEFTVALDDDTDPEASSGTITATVQSGSGYVVGTYSNAAKANIHDDDGLPTLSIADVASPVSEDVGSVNFTVTAANVAVDADITVEYFIDNGVGHDFIRGSSRRVSDLLEFRIPSGGSNYEATIVVNLEDDDLDEPDGSVSVTLNPDIVAPYAYLVDRNANKATASITDDDNAPKLTIANASGAEGSLSSNGVVRFLPTLAAISGRDITITYSTSPSGAFPVSSDDYESKTDEPIMILAGNTTPVKADGTTDYIEITTTADEDGEPNETFTLTFRADHADTTDGTTAEGTILNDDEGQVLAVSSAEVNESAGTVDLVISVSPAPTGADTVVVSYETADGSATGSP